MTAIRRALRLMNPLTMVGGSWRTTAKGRSLWTARGVLSISTFVAFFLSALSAEAIILPIIIPIPTVQITSLSHFIDSTLGTITDGVGFPCGSGAGACSSAGFSAAIAHGDEIVMTFAAPPGMRFHVFYDSALTVHPEFFIAQAQWQAGPDSISVFTPAAISFQNLTGTAPTEYTNNFDVGDAGVFVSGDWEGNVTADFTFTAVTLRFPVNNSPPGAIAFFGSVPGGVFSSGGTGPSGTPDQFLMQLEPLPDADEDGVADLYDNCPDTPNGPLVGTCLMQVQETCYANIDCVSGVCSMNQEDTGGIGLGSAPDGIGDACQCGDVNNDGIVTDIDATLIERAVVDLAPYAGGISTLPGYNKCQVVNGGSGRTCDNIQATIIQRAVVGLAPGIKQGCHAATIFP